MPGRRVPDLSAEPRLYDRVRPLAGLGEMPVIVADEIAAQIEAMPDPPAGTTEEAASWAAEAYGVVAPPFQAFFVEAQTEFDGVPVLRGAVVYDRTAGGALLGEYPPAGTRWHLHLYPFLWSRLIGRVEDYGSPCLVVHLDDQGHILDDMTALQVFFAVPAASWPGPLRDDAARAAASIVPLVLKAVGALHRRAPVEEVTPEPQQLRQARRRGELERHEYYRLKVRPHVPQSREEFAAIGAPARATPREHVVRGHFRYYHPDRPLFGRTAGAVWVPEHTRGDDAIGRIAKDYEVDGE